VSNVITEIKVPFRGRKVDYASSFWAKSIRFIPKSVEETFDMAHFYSEFQYNISEHMKSLYQLRKQPRTNFTFLEDDNHYDDGFALLSNPIQFSREINEQEPLQVPTRYSIIQQFL